MIKLKAVEEFTFGEFNKLSNVVRFDDMQCEEGRLYKNDEFECDEQTAKYLTNETPNPANRAVARLIEYQPEQSEQPEKKETKTAKKKSTSKKAK